ncbi:uncharacterized protein JCM6883_002660 [Sporobolomyces salmoneus]|uniref:uncharacterized protein n=1 Tax=Sporobolomyces salmoneus TaxID=183962 RepID=UPI003177A061
MSTSQYTFSSPFFSYACPPQTVSSAAWKSLDLAPEMDPEGEGSGGTKIEVKGSSGPGCTVSFSGWKGSEGWVQGWLNPNGTTWCCAIDSTTDWTCHEKKGGGGSGWSSEFLCSFGGLDAEKEHTLTIMNNPAGESRLLINGGTSNGRAQDELKLTDFVTIATVAKPASVNLNTFYSSTTSSSASASSSSTSSSVEDNPTSSSSPSPTDPPLSSSDNETTETSSSSSEESNLLFFSVAVGILAVVVVCILSIMFCGTRSKPSDSDVEEAGGFLGVAQKEKRTKKKKKIGRGSRKEKRVAKRLLEKVGKDEDQDRERWTTSSESEEESTEEDEKETKRERNAKSRKGSRERGKRKRKEDDEEAHTRYRDGGGDVREDY